MPEKLAQESGMDYYAHSNPRTPDDLSQWEPMLGPGGHLEAVEIRVRQFVGVAFRGMVADGDVWLQLGTLIARWHDLGKFSDAFQTYLRSVGGDSHSGEVQGKVDHASAGAQHAMNALSPGLGAMLAYPIAGHHAGLLDALHESGASMKKRLKKEVPDWQKNVPDDLLPSCGFVMRQLPQDPFIVAFAVRMLFSCLVDADFLATESFMNPEQALERPSDVVDFAAVDRHLEQYMNERFGRAQGTVASARAEVLSACRNKAEGEPGLYSLTVPTGGGKTLASLAFALRHGAVNGLDRIIYAIPFTSIIEQTAQEFRDVFKDYSEDMDGLILEHHSNFDPEDETTRSRLASENWDAPLVVTTNVQLFESLFANRTSRCRKLHRVANSVIILDEAQTLPVTLLEPCLKALRILTEQFGCTVVLCTATQPAIEYRDEFKIGLSKAIPIINDAPALYRRLKRVEVCDAGVLDCLVLSERMAEQAQGLSIVNTRRHAADLYAELKRRAGTEGSYHLSAAMTPEHRSRKLDEIRQKLKDGQPCRVVATQLIEAGVDIDFPVVWRALAGLDSIAQAAGRCNREGRCDQATTWIFRPAEEAHAKLYGFQRTSADAASQVMALSRYEDLLGLDAIEHYFRLHYWQHQQDWDKEEICDRFKFAPNDRELPLYFNFATAAEKFRFIKETQSPVIVPWDDTGRRLVEQLRGIEQKGNPAPRNLTRKLQRHTVSVGKHAWDKARHAGHLELLYDRFAVLKTVELHYSEELGLQLDNELYGTDTLCGV
jgi:CRISPR-associated endonuclease/helicase Cas3